MAVRVLEHRSRISVKTLIVMHQPLAGRAKTASGGHLSPMKLDGSFAGCLLPRPAPRASGVGSVGRRGCCPQGYILKAPEALRAVSWGRSLPVGVAKAPGPHYS